MTITLENRKAILSTLIEHLKPHEDVYAMWEAGAAAFNRLDEWSDIDLMLDVSDGCAQDVIEVVDSALSCIAPIELKYVLPAPTWHGHAQVFYRLKNHGPFMLVDLVVMDHSQPNKFLEKEIHGIPFIHFDKVGAVVPTSLDEQEHLASLAVRVEELKVRFDLFQSLCLKEVYRGNKLEALSFYQAFTLRPLVEALRIYYAPHHYQFYTRYVQHDLPEDVQVELESLFFVTSVDDIRSKRERAHSWFDDIINLLDR